MALLISGLVLFPSEENFVDLTVVNVFLVVKVEDEEPTSAILDDVYYTHHLHHKNNGGMMCCENLLNMCFISRISKDMSGVWIMNGYEWSRYLVSLSSIISYGILRSSTEKVLPLVLGIF